MDNLRCLLRIPGLCIWYDEANRWLYNQWEGAHDAASFERGANAIMTCLAAQPCTKILSDHSQVRGKWQSLSKWTNPAGFNSLAELGVVYFAWVYSPFLTDRATMEHLFLYMTRPMVAIFSDVASAYDWLQNCPSSLGPAVE
jgi:hypothetical protein